MKAPGPGQCHMGLCQDECRGGNGCLVLNRAKDGLPTNDMGMASTFSSPTFELLSENKLFRIFWQKMGIIFFFKPQPSGICWVASSIFDRGLYDGGACNSWGLDWEHFGHGKFFLFAVGLKFQDVFHLGGLELIDMFCSIFFVFNISFFDLWKAMGCILKRSFGFDFIKWVVGRKREGCRSQQPGSPTVYAKLVSTGGGGVPCEVCLSLLLAFVSNEFLATRYLCFFPVYLLGSFV